MPDISGSVPGPDRQRLPSKILLGYCLDLELCLVSDYVIVFVRLFLRWQYLAFYRIWEGRDQVLSWKLERRRWRTGDSWHWVSDLEGCELPRFPLVLTPRCCQYVWFDISVQKFIVTRWVIRNASRYVCGIGSSAQFLDFFLISLNLSQSRVLLERRARLYSRCFRGLGFCIHVSSMVGCTEWKYICLNELVHYWGCNLLNN